MYVSGIKDVQASALRAGALETMSEISMQRYGLEMRQNGTAWKIEFDTETKCCEQSGWLLLNAEKRCVKSMHGRLTATVTDRPSITEPDFGILSWLRLAGGQAREDECTAYRFYVEPCECDGDFWRTCENDGYLEEGLIEEAQVPREPLQCARVTIPTAEGPLYFLAYNAHNGFYAHELTLYENGKVYEEVSL